MQRITRKNKHHKRLMLTSVVLLLVLNLYGCTDNVSPTFTPVPSNGILEYPNSPPNLNRQETQELEINTAPTPSRMKTLTPTRFASQTETIAPTTAVSPVIPGPVSKDIIWQMQEKLFASIGIQPSGALNPTILLREPKHSFEGARWSPDGNRIAFIQIDSGIHIDHLGVIHKDGTNKKLLDKEFSSLGGLEWAADNRTVAFLAYESPESSLMPFAFNLENEEAIPLLSGLNMDLLDGVLRTSPTDNQAAFLGYIDGQPLVIQLWLLSLDGNHQLQIPLPEERGAGCMENAPYSPLTWSPDGGSLLAVLDVKVKNECRPTLWLYNFQANRWHQLPPLLEEVNGNYLYENGELEWSQDSRWISWSTIDFVYIFSVNENWKMVRKIDALLSGKLMMVAPWVQDVNGNSIFTVYKYLSLPGFEEDTRVQILGISPNGTEENDILIMNLEFKEPLRFSKGYSSPYIWQP